MIIFGTIQISGEVKMSRKHNSRVHFLEIILSALKWNNFNSIYIFFALVCLVCLFFAYNKCGNEVIFCNQMALSIS